MSIVVSINDFDMSQFENLSELFGSYFKPDDKLLTRSYTQWLYAKNPYGLARMVVAVDGERWVGFMAMIPVQLVRRDARLVAYYVVNVLVHPEYHGKHIFGRMITAAKELVGTENAILMGHPNDMALKSWQRARMHFHAPLRPSLAMPRLLAKGVRSFDMMSAPQLQSVLPALHSQAIQAEQWQFLVTEPYINWRYFEHPTNKYRLQLVEVKGIPVGFLVTRKVKPCLSLLVDQFMLNGYANDGMGRLPWFTVCFKPESATSEFSGALWPLPVKKRIPFFFTNYQQTFTVSDVMYLGLSASDF